MSRLVRDRGNNKVAVEVAIIADGSHQTFRPRVFVTRVRTESLTFQLPEHNFSGCYAWIQAFLPDRDLFMLYPLQCHLY